VPEDHTLQARREGLATFLKMIACSTEFFNSGKYLLKRFFSKQIFQAEFQKFLFSNTASAKEQVDYIKQQNMYYMSSNPDYQAAVTRILP